MKQARIIPVFVICAFLLIGLAGYSIVNTLFMDYNPERYIILPDYKAITIEDPSITLTQEDIEYELEAKLLSDSVRTRIDGPAQDEDIITFNYEGKINGEVNPEFTDTDFTITLGNDQFIITGLDPYLEGCKTGDVITATLTTPDEDEGILLLETEGEYYNTDIDFTFTVTKIERIITPVLDDDYAKQQGYDTAEEFMDAFSDQLRQTQEENNQESIRQALWQSTVEQTEVHAYPREELNDLVAKFTANQQLKAEEDGFTLAEYAEFLGYQNMEAFHDDILLMAQNDLKEQMIIKAIAARENIEVTDQVYEQYLNRYIDQYGFTREELLTAYNGEVGFRNHVLVTEVYNLIQRNATLT